MNDNKLYSRQEKMNLKFPKSITVIGVGGTGAWVALFHALMGCEKLILIDYDKLEIHNLNRTPFKIGQVGEYKVNAMKQLINERRGDDCEVIPITMDINDVKSYKKIISDTYVIDCRDTDFKIADLEINARTGYDGFEYYIESNPEYEDFGEGSGYSIVPSFVGTPAFIGILSIILSLSDTDLKQPVYGTLNQLINKDMGENNENNNSSIE